MTEFKKWNSLNQFHEVMKAINYSKYAKWLDAQGNKLTYKGKIKLHGTNASITINTDGSVIAGKRSSFLPVGGVGGDNAGFAGWVKENEEFFSSLRTDDETITIYGEWCGPGIQHGVSCSETDRKHFYIFSLDCTPTNGDSVVRFVEPDDIEEIIFLEKEKRHPCEPDQVIVLPWHCKVEFDFLNPEKMKTTLENINKETESIGVCDPFIAETHGIEGAGEGLVFYPVPAELTEDRLTYASEEELEYFSVFNFKAKSEHHRVNKTKTAVAANPETIATMKNFVVMFCTEARFEQAFDEAVSRQKDMKLTGEFIKWVCQDIMKESETERETLDIEWKKLAGAVSKSAAEWYKAKVSET